MTAFEWGSGQSTLWLSQQVDMLYSIEHDRIWYDKIGGIISTKGISNVNYILSPPSKDHYNHKQMNVTKDVPPIEKNVFTNYCAEISAFPDKFFDIILIDGRERVGCFLYCIDKLKDGGYCILDDSYRMKYKRIFVSTEWERTRYNFGYQQTTVFKK